MECPKGNTQLHANHLLAVGVTTARSEIIARYCGFFQKLRHSASKEVQLLASIVGRDLRTTTGNNLKLVSDETKIDPWVVKTGKVRAILDEKKCEVPHRDKWRLPFLAKLLEERQHLHYQASDTTEIQGLINALCVN